jgi:uncharacterized protein (TIGR02246 family)
MTVPAGLEEFVAALRRAWSSRDPTALAELWDGDGAALTYVAEEAPGVLRGREMIEAYWRDVAGRFREIEVQLQPLAAEILGGCAWLVGVGGFEGVRALDGARIRTEGVRVGILLRRTAQGWRVRHYMEAPLREADR